MGTGRGLALGGPVGRISSKKVDRRSKESLAQYIDPQDSSAHMRSVHVNSAHVCFCPFVLFPISPYCSYPIVFHDKPLPLYLNLFFG